MTWNDMKVWVVQALELDKDALHIYAAILAQLLTAIVTRRSLANILPWLAAVAITLTNEYFDYQRVQDADASVVRYQAAAWHDMWNTMLLPTLLFLLARYWPRLLSHQLASGQPKARGKHGEPD
ncbi:MAG: hypothetical protein AAGE37_06735 [Pseudomonadota bacterium]